LTDFVDFLFIGYFGALECFVSMCGTGKTEKQDHKW